MLKPISLLAKLSKKYLKHLGITVVAMLGLVAAQLLIPAIIRALIDRLSIEPLDANTLDFITKLTAIALIIFIARGFMQFLRSFYSHKAGWGAVSDARSLVYRHVQKLSLRFYEDRQTGQIMSRIINDTSLFEKMVSHALPDIIVSGMTLIAVTAILLSMNWKLTLITLIPIPLIIYALWGYTRKVRPAFRKRQKSVGDLHAVINDSLSGIREVKTFAQEEAEIAKVDNRIYRVQEENLVALKLMAIYNPMFDFAAGIGQLLVIFFGSRMAVAGTLSIADLVAFFLYLDNFYQPVRTLGNSMEAVTEAMAGFERIADILTVEPEIASPKVPIPLPKPVKGEVRFDHVSFHYLEGEDVLKDISITVPAGTSLALVGPTGVGKSTFASLIPRFYDTISGHVMIDGIDVRDLSLQELNTNVGMVLQDVFLFSGSVRDNIMFGKPEATEEEMLEAARIANALEFIERMPDGFDTMIGERGVKLSGGQQQRLSIARAVLKNSPILILDEATSSVDTETEKLIQESLDQLIEGRTTIIIAHRLSTVRNADRIIVLEENHITETGTHEELLALGGTYYRLYTTQQELS